MLKKWLKKIPFALSKNHAYDLQAKKVMKKVLQPNSNCVDVGSHEGEFLDIFLAISPLGKHFAFEPLPNFYAQLKENYGKKCEIFNLALSDQKGNTTFNHVISNPAYSGLQKRTYDRANEKDTTIMVKTDLLDAVIPKDIKIDFIKIDVEGGEFQVLNGAKELIKAQKPVIIFEHGLGAADSYDTTPEMIYDLLVEDCGSNIATMKVWLNNQPPFSKEQFCRHFYQNLDYYYIAFG